MGELDSFSRRILSPSDGCCCGTNSVAHPAASTARAAASLAAIAVPPRRAVERRLSASICGERSLSDDRRTGVADVPDSSGFGHVSSSSPVAQHSAQKSLRRSMSGGLWYTPDACASQRIASTDHATVRVPSTYATTHSWGVLSPPHSSKSR